LFWFVFISRVEVCELIFEMSSQKKKTKEGDEYWAYIGHYWEEREERIKKYRESLAQQQQKQQQQQQTTDNTKVKNQSLNLPTEKITTTSNSPRTSSSSQGNKNNSDKK
jgi:hypothetical protein